MIAARYGKPVQHRVRPFTTVEVKPQVLVAIAALAVDNTVSGAILAAEGNGLAFEINIPVAVAAVGPVSNKNRITIVGIINRRLDVVEIRRIVVINGDCFSVNLQYDCQHEQTT
jgi:hypothetical protein